MRKRVLITGGAGFIGSSLSEALVTKGHKVICLDNLLTGFIKNINPLMSHKNFKFVELDVSKKIKANQFGNIDEVYHLASPADPNESSSFSYINYPFETMEVNSVGTWNMCEFAYKNKAKLLYSSTSEVYGDPLVSPQKEDYRGNVSTIGPRSVYDEAKRFGETIVSAYVRKKGLDARIVRIFNTYGPKMNINEGRAVVNFIRQAITNQPITIYGKGVQTRSFCYIDDQVNGLILAMEKSLTKGEVFNIGNNDEKTILEFAQSVKRVTDSDSKIVFSRDLPIDDPMQRKPDIEKAKKILGWEPKIGLVEGLKKTIDYFATELRS